MSFTIEVRHAPGLADPRADWVRSRCRELRLRVERVETFRLFELAGIRRPDAQAAAANLLADPVTERHRVLASSEAVPGRRAGAVTIDVWYRPEVQDPAAESVEKGLRDLGLGAPERVRCGQRAVLAGRVSRRDAERLAQGALANEVVHEWRIG